MDAVTTDQAEAVSTAPKVSSWADALAEKFVSSAQPDFAQALSTYRDADDAHDAACTAFGPHEMRSFKDKAYAETGEYAAAAAAEGKTCSASICAWANLMETPAPDFDALLAKVRALQDQAIFPTGREAVYDDHRHGCPTHEHEAMGRILSDLERLATKGEGPRSVPPNRRLWEHRMDAYRKADEELNAFNGEDDEALLSAFSEAEKAILFGVSPDIEGLRQKLRILIEREVYSSESFDDGLLRRLNTDDLEVVVIGLAYQDTETFLRRAGVVIPLNPRSFIWRLKSLGCIVTPTGIDFGGSDSSEAVELVQTLQVDDVDMILAAAWIDEYIEAGGTLHVNHLGDRQIDGKSCSPSEDVLFVGVPLPDTPDRDRLREMISLKDGELRLAVVALAKQMMKGRGTLLMVRKSDPAQPLPEGSSS